MTVNEESWAIATRVVRRAIGTSLHCSIASTNPDGSAHVTPIGSVLLDTAGSAVYFDVFNQQLAANVSHDPRVTILAVDSGRLMWIRSLLGGRFVRPPGVRLTGTVSAPRASTADEVARFHRVLGPLLRTRGGGTLWRTLPRVRDVRITDVHHLRMGAMTG